MLFYFTATGNSLYVAKQLDDTRVSIARAIHDEGKTYQADKIGIVCPIFGHEIPPPVKRFLSTSTFETDYFYLILTYGNRHGGAAELAQAMLQSIGIHPSYIALVLMVDNFLPGFDMNEQKKIDKKVEGQIEPIRSDIDSKRFFIPPVTDQDRAAHKEYMDRMVGMPKDVFSNIYRVTDDCIGCGICRKICPEKCFTIDGQKSVWNPDNCMLCMACIHACPMMAIQMRIPEKNPGARYRNENISICEIVEANNQWDKTSHE